MTPPAGPGGPGPDRDRAGRGPVVVAGLGQSWCGDLDLGSRFCGRCREREWPDGVMVEDLSLAAQHVLHRLWELRPTRLVLAACHPRGGPPGAVRRRVVAEEPPPEEADVQARLGESTGGVVDLDHAVAVTRWFGALPHDTVVLEVEPGDVSFGTELSDAARCALEDLLDLAAAEALRPG